ncbi:MULTISPECIES: AAA family ATPase [Rhizobium]|uniref:Endonuclease GajA/Old nuclease/RecF-like AAA domain-containing protein n=1 Tax=Rhizobium paranaense TaxID=1650438 RepID=A0A7W8XYQ9_9HYPH|nr:AAA family ATPase [Rhizobium paranaense]MBB5578047.1 hypothetical protein [Rhizobium paranaense]
MKFKVSNLGKINLAEVTLSPLTILVGKNNTGKSYLASLIWALGNIDSPYFWPDWPEWPIGEDTVPNWLAEFCDLDGTLIGRSLLIDNDKAADILAFIRDTIDRNLPAYLSEIFAFPGFSETKLSIEDADFQPFTISIGPDISGDSEVSDKDEMILWVDFGDGDPKMRLFFAKDAAGQQFNQFRIVTETCGHVLFGPDWEKYSRQAYIPAARTGLMLALPALQQQAFSHHTEQAQTPFPATLRHC